MERGPRRGVLGKNNNKGLFVVGSNLLGRLVGGLPFLAPKRPSLHRNTLGACNVANHAVLDLKMQLYYLGNYETFVHNYLTTNPTAFSTLIDEMHIQPEWRDQLGRKTTPE